MAIIFLSQKVAHLLYSYVILRWVDVKFLDKIYFTQRLSREEKALKWITQTETISTLFGWLLASLMIAIALLMAKQKKERTKNPIRLKTILLVIILGIGTVLLTNGLVGGARSYFSIKSNDYTFIDSPIPIYISWSLVGILIPCFEELFYRGFMLSKLQEGFSYHASVILQAILFSVSHLDLLQGISVFILGVISGYIVAKTRTIKSGILLHIIFNLLNLYLPIGLDISYNYGQLLAFVALGGILCYIGLDGIRVTRIPTK